MSQQSFLNQVKEGAINGWQKYKILPSISAAQACLESGWGGSALAKAPNYNLFGIKTSSDWTGPKVNMRTQEWSASKGYYYVYADFRVYESWAHSIEQHGAFFTNTEWRRNNYRKVIGEKDYKKAAQELRNAGYATDPKYPSKLIEIIEQYNLQEWDRVAFAGGNGGKTNPSSSNNTSEPRVVGGSITTEARNDTSNRSVTVIGDSLGVGTEPHLKSFTWKSANYNSYGSRQWTHGTKVYNALEQLQDIISSNQLNDYVVMILGTNRGVNPSEIQRAVNMIGSSRKLLLVDTDSAVNHKASVASAYMLASETYSNVFYVNWSHYAQASYYGSDNIHMTSAGYKAHAEYIVQAIYEVANTEWSTPSAPSTSTSSPAASSANIESLSYDDEIFVSPKGESIIYNKTLNDLFGFRPKKGQVMWIERVLKVNSDDPEEMLKEGLKYMKEHAAPAVQYVVSLKELPDTVSIGDTGIFIDHEFNPPLAIEARVLEINTSETVPNSNTVTIGNVKELFPQDKEDILALQRQLQETRDELLDEFHRGAPLQIVIEGSNGLLLSGNRSDFETELIQGTTEDRVIPKGEHVIELYSAKKTDNDFRLSGKLADNIIDHVDDLTIGEPITALEVIVPEEGENPQGDPTPNPLEPQDAHELDVTALRVDFLDGLGQVVLEETVPLYHDAEFTFPIENFNKNIRKIKVYAPKDLTFERISFTEKEANRAKISSTQLVARVYQGSREVTERFNNFSWVRVSEDFRADEGWNDDNKFVQSNNITVYAGDIEQEESTFVCRLFDDDFQEVLASSSAVVKIGAEGKSAYQVAVENGFEGTLDEWIDSLKGNDGENGIPGEPGEDGRTPYLHVAWADSPMGDGFSTHESEGKDYMGTYTDFEEEDSQNYLDYKWMRVKGEPGEPGRDGEPGEPGKDGEPGQDGTSTYVHLAYADSDDGLVRFSLTQSARKYVGFYTDEDRTPSREPSKYKWMAVTSDEWRELAIQLEASLDNVIVSVATESEKITALRTDVDITKNNFLITHTDEILNTITTTERKAGDLEGRVVEVEQTKEDVDTYFRFDDAFTIGKSNAQTKLRLTNDEIQFLDGETKGTYITGNTMVSQNITIQDKLNLPQHTFEDGEGVTVVRFVGDGTTAGYSYKLVESFETVPFTTRRISDNTIPKGQEIISVTGRDGRIKVTKQVEYLNGVPTGVVTEVSRVTETEMIQRVIRVGTKEESRTLISGALKGPVTTTFWGSTYASCYYVEFEETAANTTYIAEFTRSATGLVGWAKGSRLSSTSLSLTSPWEFNATRDSDIGVNRFYVQHATDIKVYKKN